jgi:hypothetical protein
MKKIFLRSTISLLVLFVLFMLFVLIGDPVARIDALTEAIRAWDAEGAGYATGHAIAWLISGAIEFVVNLIS